MAVKPAVMRDARQPAATQAAKLAEMPDATRRETPVGVRNDLVEKRRLLLRDARKKFEKSEPRAARELLDQAQADVNARRAFYEFLSTRKFNTTPNQ